MDALVTIRLNLDEKQFTQLAKNLINGNYVVSVYFRCTNKFKTVSYKSYEQAFKLYEKMTE